MIKFKNSLRFAIRWVERHADGPCGVIAQGIRYEVVNGKFHVVGVEGSKK